MSVLLFVFLPFVLTQNCYTYVGDVLMDLSPLQGVSVETAANGYEYYFSPCRNAYVDQTGVASSLVQVDSSSRRSAISVFDNNVQWSSGPDFIQMATQNGAKCSIYDVPRAAMIRFMCGPHNSLVLANIPTPTTCYELPGWSFIMYTPLMCQNPPVHALYIGGSESYAFATLRPFSPRNDADRTVFAYVYVPYFGNFYHNLPIWSIQDDVTSDSFTLAVSMVSWGSGPSQAYLNFILTSTSSSIESTGFAFNQWYVVAATYCPGNHTHSLSIRSETATGPAGWVTSADVVSGSIESIGSDWSVVLSIDSSTQRSYPGLLVQYFTAYPRVMGIAEIMTITSERSSGLNVTSTDQVFNWDWTPASYQHDTVHGIVMGESGNVGLAVKCRTGVTFSSNGWSLPGSCQTCSTCPYGYTTLCSADHDAVCAECVQDGCVSSFWGANGQCVCTQCSSYEYELINGTCYHCPVYECDSYYEACACSVCSSGYQLINNTCEYCSTSGCDVYNYGSCSCMSCYSGYALVGGECKDCEYSIPNCMEYGFVGACICSICNPGYDMSGGFCTYDNNDYYNYDDSNSNNTLWISTPVGCSALILMLGILVRRRRAAAAAAAAAANNNARQPLLVGQPVSAAPAQAPRAGGVRAAAGKKPKAVKKKSNKAALVSPVAGAGAAGVVGAASVAAGEPQEGLSSGGSGAAMGPPGGMACNDVDVYGEGNEHPEGVGGYYRYDEENARGEDDGTIG